MKRRRRPEHSWDRLKGTRMEVLPLNAGTVRRVCITTTDPLPAVVSFGRNAMVTNRKTDEHTLRFIAFDDWNHDSRELHQIPEAREYCRRLWHEGKPLLRVLSESSADTPADDRLGLSQHDISQLGLGWFEIYTLGMCDVIAAELVDGPDGPGWNLAAVGPKGASREAVRAELLEMSPANPDGYTYDDAANRRVFVNNNMPMALNAVRKNGAGHVVLVLSLLDDVARQLADALAPEADHREHIATCREKDLHPAAVLAVPVPNAAQLVRPFAPGAAGTIDAGPSKPGCTWGVFVAFNGTSIVELHPPTEAAT